MYVPFLLRPSHQPPDGVRRMLPCSRCASDSPSGSALTPLAPLALGWPRRAEGLKRGSGLTRLADSEESSSATRAAPGPRLIWDWRLRTQTDRPFPYQALGDALDFEERLGPRSPRRRCPPGVREAGTAQGCTTGWMRLTGRRKTVLRG